MVLAEKKPFLQRDNFSWTWVDEACLISSSNVTPKQVESLSEEPLTWCHCNRETIFPCASSTFEISFSVELPCPAVSVCPWIILDILQSSAIYLTIYLINLSALEVRTSRGRMTKGGAPIWREQHNTTTHIAADWLEDSCCFSVGNVREDEGTVQKVLTSQREWTRCLENFSCSCFYYISIAFAWSKSRRLIIS